MAKNDDDYADYYKDYGYDQYDYYDNDTATSGASASNLHEHQVTDIVKQPETTIATSLVNSSSATSINADRGTSGINVVMYVIIGGCVFSVILIAVVVGLFYRRRRSSGAITKNTDVHYAPNHPTASTEGYTILLKEREGDDENLYSTINNPESQVAMVTGSGTRSGDIHVTESGPGKITSETALLQEREYLDLEKATELELGADDEQLHEVLESPYLNMDLHPALESPYMNMEAKGTSSTVMCESHESPSLYANTQELESQQRGVTSTGSADLAEDSLYQNMQVGSNQ